MALTFAPPAAAAHCAPACKIVPNLEAHWEAQPRAPNAACPVWQLACTEAHAPLTKRHASDRAAVPGLGAEPARRQGAAAEHPAAGDGV